MRRSRAKMHEGPIALSTYLASGAFRFSTLQTWLAELVSIGIYLVLSILLRQEGSAESKPVAGCDSETGAADT